MVSLLDPAVWIVGGIAIAVVALILIYFRVLLGGGR